MRWRRGWRGPAPARPRRARRCSRRRRADESPARAISRAGCWRAPHSSSVRPDACSASASSSIACRPVASIAVMLRSRRMTISRQRVEPDRGSAAACRSRRTGTARGCGRSVTYGGIVLSCRMCTCPSRTYSSVTAETVVVSATRWMNSSAASTMPTPTATVRSANTVSAKVTSQTAMSVFGQPQQLGNLAPTRPCCRRRP